MERLSGLDAGFLYMETPSFHMHTLKIGIVDPSTSPAGYEFGRVKQLLTERLHLLPPFRRKLVNVPLGLHHPLWIEDENFDLDYHVHRVGVPQPGGDRELHEMIGHIAGRPLDRDRPLWELWVVEGLEGGRIAFVTKMHHALADGSAASALLANVMTPDPTPGPPSTPTRPWRSERTPPAAYVALRAILDQLLALIHLPTLIARTIRAVRALIRQVVDPAAKPPRPVLDAPMTSFNGALTPHRTFATATLDFDDVRAVRRAFDVSVNDVVLATVAGALRAYLDKRGEHVPRALVAGVPVGTDEPGDEPRLWGNRVSNIFTTLATDIDDPVARLRKIHVVTNAAKQVQDTLGKDMMSSWVEYTPALLLRGFMRTYSAYRLADRHRPPINLVVSNVPGPPVPLYVDGARLTELYSVGPILEGAALNITVWSYSGKLHFAALACRERVPDPHDITDHLAPALAELVELASAASPAAI